MSSNDPNANYKSITESFFKTAINRGNLALLRNNDLQTAIYTRTRLKRKYWQDPSRENVVAYKKRKKSITNCFNKFSDKSLQTTKSSWIFVKPFLTNKGTFTGCDITIVDGKKIILANFELAKTFNNHYLNTLEVTVALRL